MRFLTQNDSKFKLQLPPSTAARHVTSAGQGRESGATSGSVACKKTRDLCLESGPACGGRRECAQLGRKCRTKRAFAKSRCGARVAPAHGVAVSLQIRAVWCASRYRQCRGCMWVGRSGGLRRGSTTASDRGLRAPAHPASTTAGRGAAVCPLLSRIRIPVLFGTRAPREVVGQIRRPRRLRAFSCITCACPPTPRRRLRALVSPARSSPPISISNDSPPPSPRSVSGVWACVAAVRVIMTSRLWFRPLVCVGGRSRRCFHRRRQNVRRSTDANAGLCSAHGTTQRDHHGGWGDLHGGAFRSFGVCIAATGRPRSVCSATRENEDGGSDGICAAPQSPQTNKRSLQTA